jgi:hypothetical protein
MLICVAHRERLVKAVYSRMDWCGAVYLVGPTVIGGLAWCPLVVSLRHMLWLR